MVGSRKGLARLPPRWQVTNATVTPGLGCLYRVVHTGSAETVYVQSQGALRLYARDHPKEWDTIPLAVRQEIDRALVCYLMEGRE